MMAAERSVTPGRWDPCPRWEAPRRRAGGMVVPGAGIDDTDWRSDWSSCVTVDSRTFVSSDFSRRTRTASVIPDTSSF